MPARLILGQRGSGEFGLFISKPGIDVWGASDANLLFAPYNYYGNPVLTGTTNQTINISHNFGFIPFYVLSGDMLNEASLSWVVYSTIDENTLSISNPNSRVVGYAIWYRKLA
jgi:hypothetical protein